LPRTWVALRRLDSRVLLLLVVRVVGVVVVLYNMKGNPSQTPLDSCSTEGREGVGGGEAEQSGGGRLMIGDGGEKITFIYHFRWVTNYLISLSFSLRSHLLLVSQSFGRSICVEQL